VTSIFALRPRSGERNWRLCANQENQARGGRAGGEGAKLASFRMFWKTACNFTIAGTATSPATGGIPWKHNDRHATMNGHALSEEDLSDEDLSGWHGISSAIPAMDDACTDCSMPFIVAA
jgi:hypothetical protein